MPYPTFLRNPYVSDNHGCRSHIAHTQSSLASFANTDAAAIAHSVASPLTTHTSSHSGPSVANGWLPSTNTRTLAIGANASRTSCTAARIARFVACKMFTSSITPCSSNATA